MAGHTITISSKLAEAYLHAEVRRAKPSQRNPLLYTAPDVEERIKQRSLSSTFDYRRVRRFYEDQLKDIVEHVWSTFSLPRDEQIIEMGCGPFGYFCNRLRPEGISEEQWVQRELVAKFVNTNRQTYPHRRIEQGSFYSIEDRDISLITGLSSLDSPQFIGVAIDQVAKALKPGGYFLHIQDVLPDEKGVLYFMHEKEFGLQHVLDHHPEGCSPIPIGFEFDQGRFDIVSLFGAVLKLSIEERPDLKLITHGYYTHTSILPGHLPHHNSFLFVQSNSEDTSPLREFTALVTLFQKK